MAQPQTFLSAMMPVVLLAAAFAVLPSICQAQSYLVTTVAGGGVPSTPAAATSVPLGPVISVAAGAHGDVYFIATDYVFQMNAAGILTRVAGTSSAGYSGDGGLATNAQLNVGQFTAGVAVDGSGNVYITDSHNNVIRKVAAATGIITTVAGTGTPGFSGDGGPASSAELNDPTGVAVDGFGSLYVADNGNYRIRKVAAATGIITTVAGNGGNGNNSGDGGPATSAVLSGASDVAVDGSGNFYIMSVGAIRKVAAATGIITTVAGNGNPGYSGDGGPATSAQLEAVNLAVDNAGNIYIADRNDDVIRKVTAATGIITTVAGNGNPGYSGNGGPATSAEMGEPNAVAVDGTGDLYIADTYNFVIRKVTATSGIITTVAGNGAAGPSPAGGLAVLAQLASPAGVAVDSTGNLYFANGNVVSKLVPATGVVTTVAGTGVGGFSGDGGPASSAGLSGPTGVAVDGIGNLYIADSNDGAIRKVTAATGIITTVAGPGTSTHLQLPADVAVDGSGNVYFVDLRAVYKMAAATGMITTVESLTQTPAFYGAYGLPAVAVDWERVCGPKGGGSDRHHHHGGGERSNGVLRRRRLGG
jgi:sugar lactone lactonase YvrE